MKAPAFDYVRPATISAAVAALAAHRGSAKVIAGGQSLVPMLNFRLLAPGLLVDINGIAELDQIFALHRQDLLADLLGLLLGREGDEDQIAHGRCPSMC